MKQSRQSWNNRMLFISGRVSLDLAHTGNQREGIEFEKLHTPDDFKKWLKNSPLHLEAADVNSKEFELAYELRDALWYAGRYVLEGVVPAGEHIATINRIAALPPLTPALAKNGNSITWGQPATALAALSTIARDGIDVFAHLSEQPIQECSNPHCPLMFVDGSRPGKRKWCSMERCGNLQKTARYRAHQKSAQPQ